jgi:hypothetical protein
MNCEDLNHYFSTRFEQIQFENIQDANLYIENISFAKVKYQENYYELSEILISDYIREVWISEFPPSEKFNKEINTVEITDDLILGNAKPDLIDDRLWKKLNNIHIALINIILTILISLKFFRFFDTSIYFIYFPNLKSPVSIILSNNSLISSQL